MNNFENEHSFTPPPNAVGRQYNDSEPILYAYDCVLLERKTDRGLVYTAVNLTNDKSTVICRRKDYPLESELIEMVKLIGISPIAGMSRLQADRPARESISYDKAREILQAVFTEVMPQFGFAVRNEQIDLADHILSEVAHHGVTLAEAETGTGKTLAYLIAAVIAKRGRLNDFHNMSLYPEMQYADMAKLPIVIATSSIALQRAILTEYIPQLSEMLLESGVIKEPLTAILRKGHGHYVCAKKLQTYISNISNRTERQEMEKLLLRGEVFDLAELEGLSPKIRQNISVEGRCFDTCPHRETCQYLTFREQTQSLDIDIQVCNHNYLLADTLHRANGQQPLIPNYQLLIIDEAHKFLPAARTMYGSELSSMSVPEMYKQVSALVFRRDGLQNFARRASKKLFDENARLFESLAENAVCDEDDADSDNKTADIDDHAARHLRNIRSIADRLIPILYGEAFFAKAEELLSWVNGKYGADTTVIDLNWLLPILVNDKDMLQEQVISIHKAICNLNEIKHRVKTEHKKRLKTSLSYNTEREVIKNTRSKVLDAIWQQSRRLFRSDTPMGRNSERIVKLIWQLTQIRDQADALAKHGELIYWLEIDGDENRLCAIPKDLGKCLFTDQWGKRTPTILTSGTLSAGGDFTHTKRTLGLDNLASITETSKPSPFNHHENALLYISEKMPFPKQRSDGYITAIADEVEKLVVASHGHAAVLFTSYRVMDKVWTLLKERGLSFPVFRLNKGGVREIERFKESSGGVLFASGALWEGIDIPGDALSLLIIVKLPFKVPDPISKYEQTQYPDFHAYRDNIIVPEMLIKLKQGFGRLIRTETDTGVVAILDSRSNRGGAYRQRVLAALPDCRVTADIADVGRFIRTKKPHEYFM